MPAIYRPAQQQKVGAEAAKSTTILREKAPLAIEQNGTCRVPLYVKELARLISIGSYGQ
jgi:hypothetical protein